MLGSHVMKSVGVVFVRGDSSVKIHLSPDFVDQMHNCSDDDVYHLVKGKVRQYVHNNPRFDGEDLGTKTRFFVMAIFAHYLKNYPEKGHLKTVLREYA